MKIYRLPFFFLVAVVCSLSAIDNSLVDLIASNAPFEPSKQLNIESNKPKELYFTHVRNIQEKKSLFSQVNIGIGFLYFSQVNGNFGIVPDLEISYGTCPFQNKLSYNKTPLFEYLIGLRIANWFKFAFSYQNQQSIYLSSSFMQNFGANFTEEPEINPTLKTQFTSYLSLNAIMAKFYFENPKPLVYKTVSFTNYIAPAIGASWQSWGNVNLNIVDGIANLAIGNLPLNMKIIPNVAWMVDSGLKIRSIRPNTNFSLYLGCKCNFWGKTRNIGQVDQQQLFRRGLFVPFSIGFIYSFAPYVGFQWNFPTQNEFCFQRANVAPNEIVWIKSNKVLPINTLFTQINLGPNFLYFSRLRGNIGGKPSIAFSEMGYNAPLKGHLQYGRTPIFEYIIGFKPISWFKYAFSFQTQSNVIFESHTLPGFVGANDTIDESPSNQFRAFLNLNSIMLKLYFVPPFSLISKRIAYTPYMAFAGGGSWQSWTNIQNMRYSATPGFAPISINSKNVANASFMVDMGISIKNADPLYLFTISLGCKYNQWGQVRNLGSINDQSSYRIGFFKPISAKVLYSFNPYIGMQWDFPITYNYSIRGKAINRWLPFFTPLRNMQKRSGAFMQMNIGAGFLSFNKVRANFSGSDTIISTDTGSAPFKGKMNYNVTPLYEYLIGYRLNNCLKVSLSFQNQNALFIFSDQLNNFSFSSDYACAHTQFRANLNLNSLMTKFYIELPFAFVFKGWATTIYMAPAVGASWQSWINVSASINGQDTDSNAYTAALFPVNQKIIASVGWMIDAGLRIKNATECASLSLVFGCKYNAWGQTRNLGTNSQQSDGLRYGFLDPLKIKTIFSFAPYIGFQWDF